MRLEHLYSARIQGTVQKEKCLQFWGYLKGIGNQPKEPPTLKTGTI